MEVHACDVDLVRYMTPNNFATAEREFLTSQRSIMPNFTYDHYDFNGQLAKLSEIDHQLDDEQSGLHPAQVQIISEYLAEVKLKLENLMTMQRYREERDSGASQASLAPLRKSIEDANVRLNGLPEPDVYRCLLENPTAKNTVGFVPEPELIQKFREIFENKWAKSFTRIDKAKYKYSAQEVCDLVNTIIREDFEFKTDFYAEVDEKKTGMNVDQIDHILNVPLYRSNGDFTPETVRRIVLGHETFGHLYRAAFMQSKYPEIGIPLPGYITFEEGVTKCIEQALSGKFEAPGVESYVICGLAACDKLNFKEAFDRYCEYARIRRASPALSEKDLRIIFARTARAFRGTGDIPWSNSIVYFTGPDKVWQFIDRNIDNPELLWRKMFESGKTDPGKSQAVAESLRRIGGDKTNS